MICGYEFISAFCQEVKVNFFFLNFPMKFPLYFHILPQKIVAFRVCPCKSKPSRVPLRQTTVWCFRSGGALCWWKIKAWLPQCLCSASLSGALKGVFHCQGTILFSVLPLKVYIASQQWLNIKTYTVYVTHIQPTFLLLLLTEHLHWSLKICHTASKKSNIKEELLYSVLNSTFQEVFSRVCT